MLVLYTICRAGVPTSTAYTDRRVAGLLHSLAERPVPDVDLRFLPMNHVAGRGVLFGTLAHGGTVESSSGPLTPH
ncbi:hypothetical protein GZH49_39535 [Nocardia terpenica]|uniref:hypothetical protein n=1 Tax=Nocardia terpenica TaxID=455432 RepID=UPI002FE0E795